MESIFIEAEHFNDTGGWVIDQQSIASMGSPYLMAHGLGIPVDDAMTSVVISQSESYRIWVRTRNWIEGEIDQNAPGKFRVIINNEPLMPLFGVGKNNWHWQDGGSVWLEAGDAEIRLHDLTGFNGRCDAILLTSDHTLIPPDDGELLRLFR
ncbi:MAG: pyridine nucleotide-disulfide oxidoreductase, partial [Proteiniphilum sp.]|nr:pyridine nucleotide-disulfide oxidoreductase [Proteiniphilum sp.]